MNLTDTIKAVQRKVGVVDDGLAGPVTWAAVAKAVGVGQRSEVANQRSEVGGQKSDERSEKNIATLLPNVQTIARGFLIALNTFLTERAPHHTAKIISGTRSYAEQDAIYEQGRTKPGNRVTKARGGYSNHNFGIAFDIGIFEGTEYLEESSLYDDAGRIGKTLGLIWGGDWVSFQDKPHFEWRPSWAADLTENAILSELRTRKAKGEAIA